MPTLIVFNSYTLPIFISLNNVASASLSRQRRTDRKMTKHATDKNFKGGGSHLFEEIIPTCLTTLNRTCQYICIPDEIKTV